MRDLNYACLGLGINSVAMLLECTKRGVIFDAIVFADPGSEWKTSYNYLSEILSPWLKAHNQPDVTIVKQVTKDGEFEGLYNYSIRSGTLPSIAYGFKSCSQKFKKFPQDKYCNNWPLAQQCWADGFKIRKYIGYDADEGHRSGTIYDDNKYSYHYPLVEWDWGRFECAKRITDEGLPLPPKSSCTFCPSMKVHEIINLYEKERAAFYDAVEMERVAKPNLTSVKGLGRTFSWWDIIIAYKYLKLIEKHGTPSAIPVNIQKLMKKINNSKPIPLNDKSKIQVADLFSGKVEISCDCYDG